MVLSFHLNGFVKQMYVKKEKGNIFLYVELKSKVRINLYYDNQKPASPNALFKYWFSESSSEAKLLHRFHLMEFSAGKAYYTKIEQVTGKKQVSPLYVWAYPQGAPERYVIDLQRTTVKSGTL